MINVNPYLTFDGTCEKAFVLYAEAFGAKVEMITKFKDMPPQDGGQMIVGEMGERIMHVTMPVSNQFTLMGSDVLDSSLVMGNNTSLSVNCSSEEEANTLFAKLSNGGKVIMPLQKTFWNAYFGMCTDPFGIQWMFNYDYPAS